MKYMLSCLLLLFSLAGFSQKGMMAAMGRDTIYTHDTSQAISLHLHCLLGQEVEYQVAVETFDLLTKIVRQYAVCHVEMRRDASGYTIVSVHAHPDLAVGDWGVDLDNGIPAVWVSGVHNRLLRWVFTLTEIKKQ